MVETTPYPRCQALNKEILKKRDGNNRPWSFNKVAMLLRVRFNRERVRVDHGTVLVDSKYLQQLVEGQAYAPDTLRSQVANILGVKQKEAFPEYMVACRTLKREREKRQWTQAHLAEMLRRRRRKVRDTEISSFECGSRYCHPATREVIARVFEMDEPDLFPEYYPGGFNSLAAQVDRPDNTSGTTPGK